MNVWGAVVAVIFGIVWTILAASSGAPAIFPIFGVLFIITGVISGVYNYKNATSKNRYSSFDITDENEERDPLDERFGKSEGSAPENSQPADNGNGFCPYCGTPTESGYMYCRKCGKKLD